MFEAAEEPVAVALVPDIDGLDAGLAGQLARAVRERKNVLLAGAVNTGKTTLAQALIAAIPMPERLITVEDTAEWTRIKHRNRCALFYSKDNRGVSEIRSEQLLEASLRMRPDRVLCGELRDGAAWTYLRGIVAGHPGCITTLHANSAEGAFNALRLMMRQHPEGKTMPDDVIAGMLREQIDIVVHLARHSTTRRIYVTSVYERQP
jgi:type IV secretion system protein VirB11